MISWNEEGGATRTEIAALEDISAAGACLELPSTVGVPDRFDLMIASETHARVCRVAWKDDTRVGVTFR